uniref:Zinc finger protein n=1 Tax=Macrostomum lignano TaxID=282301 RepID=A0A1I8HR12_9PLAT
PKSLYRSAWQLRQRRAIRASASQHGSQPHSFSEMPRRSVACPFCPRRFCRTRAAVAQYLRHVRSHGMGCDSEPEEAAATNSEAVRAAAVEQVASRNESAMQPCADGSRAVTKRHDCESVEKTRATKSAATRHRRAEGVLRPIQCDTCQKKFSRKSELKAHISAVHWKKKPHECKWCGKSFAKASHLHVHIWSHTGEKPFECEMCGKRFNRGSHLARHSSRLHAGEKAFFLRQRRAIRASASQHGSQPHSFSEMPRRSVACPFCPRRFCRTRAAVAQYLRHVRSHGMGFDSEPEEAAATNSEAVRAASVEQVASRNESAMQPCADGSRAVTKRQECESVGKTQATKSAATRHHRAQGVHRPIQCDTCQKKFSKKSHLKAHISAVHMKAKPHKCKRCGNFFSRLSHLYVHIRSHTGERPFECKVCGKRFNRSSHLTRHSSLHTGEKPFECKVCGKRVNRGSHLSRHSRLHTGEMPFECKVCGKRFRFSSGLTAHSRVHTGEKPFECKVCGRRFNRSSHLSRHSSLHTGEKPFECKCVWPKIQSRQHFDKALRAAQCIANIQIYCQSWPILCVKRFKLLTIVGGNSSGRDGVRASASQHGSQPHSFSKMRRGSVACPFCPRRFCRTRCTERRNRTSASGVGSFSQRHLIFTRFCRTRAAVAQYLRHVRSHEMGCDSEPEEAAATNSEAVRAAAVEQVASRNESVMQPCADGSRAVTKRYECESVGNTRATKSAATRHCRAEGVQRPFQCDTCQKKFSRKSNLKAHMSACEVCGKRFSVSSHLTTHSKVHTREKPFECKVCGKRFSDVSSFTRHSRLHTGEKPFECKVCGKRFSDVSSFTRHSRLHTGEKPFECKVCGKRFSYSNSLIKHSREKSRLSARCVARDSVTAATALHTQNCTEEKPFESKECSKKFNEGSGLTKHSEQRNL